MEDRESKVQSLDEYLGERGLSFPVSDFMLDKDADIARNDYSKRRIAAINEYNAKVENGEIRKPSIIETSLKTAHGHEDNPSVQAARRMLEKRGIDWKTGKKLKTLEDDSAK